MNQDRSLATRVRLNGPRMKSASDTSKRVVVASLALAAEATLETMVATMGVIMAAIVDSKTMATSTKGAITMAVGAKTTTAMALMATKDTINNRHLIRVVHKCPVVTGIATNIRTTATAMELETTTLAAKWAANSNRAGIRSDADSAAAVGSEYDDDDC